MWSRDRPPYTTETLRRRETRGEIQSIFRALLSVSPLLSQRFPKILLMLDGDQAGRRASSEIAAQLNDLCRVRVIALAGNTQPDQLSAQAIQEILTREGGQPSSY